MPLRVHLGLYQDETAVRATGTYRRPIIWKRWGDARAFDGTASIVQPLIAPLYGGRSAHELLAALLDAVADAGLRNRPRILARSLAERR